MGQKLDQNKQARIIAEEMQLDKKYPNNKDQLKSFSNDIFRGLETQTFKMTFFLFPVSLSLF